MTKKKRLTKKQLARIELAKHMARARGEPPTPPALLELGLDRGATAEDVHRAFRQRVKKAHPDGGGTSEEYQALVRARKAALAAVEAAP